MSSLALEALTAFLDAYLLDELAGGQKKMGILGAKPIVPLDEGGNHDYTSS